MPYRYLGYETRTYVRYLDAATSHTLTADPGGSYDILAAGSQDFPVPPGDGLWETADAGEAGEPQEDPEPESTKPGTAAVPPVPLTTASTEDEGE